MTALALALVALGVLGFAAFVLWLRDRRPAPTSPPSEARLSTLEHRVETLELAALVKPRPQERRA